GFGGSYSIKFPELSQQMLDKKLNAVEDTGASNVGVDCPGCKMQISGGLDKRNKDIPVKHTAEVLAEQLKQQ
ncbi:MAG: (Fe-S)-binding protein, partial [Clostridiales bacterium]|nr:(Fe-S)-binding protein [Clostridiales bacterium]MCF8012592.1 (Fe-S)-binding protein [Clostridiales bacterium]MCF8023697.1 (Fe-S)-binding protein [Clostridiales bacterium]MCF8023823.1 (Fe-S)-binding protein [Clostridiales bacterium]